MATKLIRLDDGTLVEVEVQEGEFQEIAGGVADRVDASVDKIKPVLIKVCESITSAWKEMNQDMLIEKTEIELGLSFECEGNIYVTKAKAGANLVIKLVLNPKQ
jgi:hypothetical protein